jgi:hypothetical protein
MHTTPFSLAVCAIMRHAIAAEPELTPAPSQAGTVSESLSVWLADVPLERAEVGGVLHLVPQDLWSWQTPSTLSSKAWEFGRLRKKKEEAMHG